MAGNSYDPSILEKLPKSYLDAYIGDRVIIVTIVFLIIDTICIALCYASKYISKNLKGIENWLFMPIGYLFSIMMCICGMLEAKYGGTGRHIEAVLLCDPHMIVRREQLDKAVEFFYMAAITGSKLTILTLYMRIFNSERRYRYTTYVVGVVIVLTLVTQIVLSFTMCQPFAYQWDKTIPGGKCGDIIAQYTYMGVPNITTDLIMLILPLPALYQLRVDVGTKIGLFAAFFIGSVGIIASILRFITFIHAAELFEDPTYKSVPTYQYVVAETSTYLIASCIPTMRPLKRRIFGDYSISQKIGAFITKRFGSSTGGHSWRITGPQKDRQLKSCKRETQAQVSEVSETKTPASMHLQNVGGLKLESAGNRLHACEV